MRGRMRWGDSNVELPVQKEGTAIQQAEGRANEVLSHVPSCGSTSQPFPRSWRTPSNNAQQVLVVIDLRGFPGKDDLPSFEYI